MNFTGEWISLPERTGYALRYAGEELAIETVLEWQFNTELHRRCTSIELSSKKIDTETAQLLSSITLQCRHLHTLILSKNDIRDEGAVTLARIMPCLSREITYLDLSGNGLTKMAAGEVAEAFLQQGSRSEEGCGNPTEGCEPLLDLSENLIKDAGVQLVASHMCSRVRLRLRGVGCGKEGLFALVQQKQFLAELDVGSNPIDKFGVYNLCTAIQSEIRWTSLSISHLQGLSGGTANAEMAANLATPIASCVSHGGLKDLDCSGNGLGDNGAAEVVEAIKDCEDSVERLAMNYSNCGILTATVLKDVLGVRSAGRCTVLRSLELRGNSLNDDCMRVFAKGLAQSTSLEILILAENLISTAGVKSLAEGLRLQRRAGDQPVAVVVLDLSGNRLDKEAAEVLADAAHQELMTQRKAALNFEVPWGLEKLYLKNCQIDGDLLKVADAMLQRSLLLNEAAEALSKSEALREQIQERRLRQPHSFEVFGLFEESQNDPRQFFEPMRRDGELKLKELWPELVPLPRTSKPPAAVAEVAEVASVSTVPVSTEVSTASASNALAKELPIPPADSGVSTCTEVAVMRLDDDSDEEHSPYAEVDLGDEDMLLLGLQGDMKHQHHRLDLNETPGSIRDLDELDNWYEASPKRKAGPNSPRPLLDKKPICRNLLDEYEISPRLSDSVVSASADRHGTSGDSGDSGPGETVTDPEVSERDPCASSSSQEWSGTGAEGVGKGLLSVNRRSLDFSPTSSDSISSADTESPTRGLEDAFVEFKRSTSMGSGKGMVEKGPGAPVGPILRMPKKGAKGPGKTPVLPMPVRDDLTEASGNCSSPAGSTSAAGGSPASPGPQGEGPQPSPGPKGGPKGKGKAKGPPGVPPPKSSMPDMSPSPGPAEIPPGGTPPGVKSSPKGKGEGKGPSKGPPKGSPPAKGPGKGPPSGSPNAPAKGGGKGKGEGKTKAGPPRLQEHAPLGKKLHWKADYEEPHADSVFKSLESNIDFKTHLLEEMFVQQEERPIVTRRKSVAKRPTGISILDGSRAQNLAIVMSKINALVSTQEFCQNLQELNFQVDRMSPDDVELLINVLPTAEENKKLIEYRDRVADLRDVEQNVMPFCVLHKGVVRMKVAKFALSHSAMYLAVKNRLEVLQAACEQVRTSRHFREVLGAVLQVGNFINHGVKEAVEGAIRGISVDSLSSLASFKTGAVSTMHFLCLSFMSKDYNFFQELKQSLSSVHEASKIQSVMLKGSIETFVKDVDTAEKQVLMLLNLPEEEREFAPSEEREAELREMMREWMEEKEDLKKVGDEAFNACSETQKYFSISSKAQAASASEAFFLHIATFIDLFQEAWLEIQRNPKKWDEFAEKAGIQLREKRKSLPAMSHSNSDAAKDGRNSETGASSTTTASRRSFRRSELTMQARPSRRVARDTISRRPLSSLSGFDAGAEAEASHQQVTRGVLDSVYSAVAGLRLQSCQVNLRRGSV